MDNLHDLLGLDPTCQIKDIRSRDCYLHEFKIKNCRYLKRVTIPREAEMVKRLSQVFKIPKWLGIRIMQFEWKHAGKTDIITDITGWPKNDEDQWCALAFLNGYVIYSNNMIRDSDIYEHEPFVQSTFTDMFSGRKSSYEHIRNPHCFSHDFWSEPTPNHNECRRVLFSSLMAQMK